MLVLSIITLLLLIIPSHLIIRKFSQNNFDQWVDENNFLVVLFCQSKNDKNCMKEREKLEQLSNEMVLYKDLVFGFVNKENDEILFARFNVDKFPIVKIFPYNEPIQNYPMNIRVHDLKEMILNIRKTIFDNIKTPQQTTIRTISKIPNIREIDWMDFDTTVKNPDKHSIFILYNDDCVKECQIIQRVAKVFENENEIEFYKMNHDNLGPLKQTMSFSRNPSVFWYPKTDKERGFIYSTDVRFEVLVEFINDRAGLSRDYEGQLKRDAGRILEIDRIVRENIISILLKTNINYVIFLVEKKGAELPHAKKYVDYYIAILKEIRKGFDPDQILHREQKYIDEMLMKKTLKTTELEDWRKYKNIVSAFIDFAASKLHEDINKDNKQKAELKEDLTFVTRKQYSSHDEL